MVDHLWPEDESGQEFAHLFDSVEPDQGLTAGFGLFREASASASTRPPGGEESGEETARVVGWVQLPSLPFNSWCFLRACAPAEAEKLERQLSRPNPRTGIKPPVVQVHLGPPLQAERERKILEGLGLTLEEAWAKCEARKLARPPFGW